MTLSEVKALLVSADPDIRHYFSMHNSEKPYSYWEETQQIGPVWDDQHDAANQAWKFYVHRYTRTEDDSVAAAIFETLDQDPRTTVRWSTDFDKESGYIHHIFECEGY